MKRILAVLSLLAVVGTANAQWHHGHGYGHGHWQRNYNGGWSWVVPAIIGGAVVYGATRPETVVVQQPSIVVQNPPVIVQNQNCSPWTETQNSDGTITRTRTCAQ